MQALKGKAVVTYAASKRRRSMLSDKVVTKPQLLDDGICARSLLEEDSGRKDNGGWRRGSWEQLFNRCGVVVWQDERRVGKGWWPWIIWMDLIPLNWTLNKQNALVCFNLVLRSKQGRLTAHFPQWPQNTSSSKAAWVCSASGRIVCASWAQESLFLS